MIQPGSTDVHIVNGLTHTMLCLRVTSTRIENVENRLFERLQYVFLWLVHVMYVRPILTRVFARLMHNSLCID